MVVWVDGESDYAEGKERAVKGFLDLTVHACFTQRILERSKRNQFSLFLFNTSTANSLIEIWPTQYVMNI